jgi:phospholipid/cholesterol/gamma-HCH transport system substrate-binding protein
MTVIGDSVDKAAAQVTVVLEQLTEVFSDDNRELLGKTLGNLAELTAKLDRFADTLPVKVDKIDGFVETANATLESYKALAERADGMLATNEGKIAKVITGMQNTEGRIANLTNELKKVIEENRKGLNDFTTTGLYEITNLAVDSQAAMEQFRRVMEEMERDPARFFFGRPSEVDVR